MAKPSDFLTGSFYDADTFYTHDGKGIRLPGVNAAEKDTPKGQALTDKVNEYVASKGLIADPAHGTGRYGRKVAPVYAVDKEDPRNATNIGEALVASGDAPFVDYNGGGGMVNMREANAVGMMSRGEKSYDQAKKELDNYRAYKDIDTKYMKDNMSWWERTKHGFKSGVNQGASSLVGQSYGAMSALGNAITTGGTEKLGSKKSDYKNLSAIDKLGIWMQRTGERGFMRNMEEASQYASSLNLKDLIENDGESAGDWFEYTAGLFGQAVPSLAGVAGVAVASRATGGLAKKAFMRSARGKQIQDVRKRSFDALMARGKTAADARRISNRMAPSIVDNLPKRATWGGVFAASGVPAWGDLYESVKNQYGIEAPGTTGLGAIASAGVESFGISKVFDHFFPKLSSDIKGGMVENIMKSVAFTGIAEGIPEATQEGIAILTEELHNPSDVPLADRLFNDDNFWRLSEAGLGGFLAGNAMGVPGGIARGIQAKNNQPAPIKKKTPTTPVTPADTGTKVSSQPQAPKGAAAVGTGTTPEGNNVADYTSAGKKPDAPVIPDAEAASYQELIDAHNSRNDDDVDSETYAAWAQSADPMDKLMKDAVDNPPADTGTNVTPADTGTNDKSTQSDIEVFVGETTEKGSPKFEERVRQINTGVKRARAIVENALSKVGISGVEFGIDTREGKTASYNYADNTLRLSPVILETLGGRVNADKSKKGGREALRSKDIAEIIFHEVGHAVDYHTWHNAPDNVKNAIIKDYAKIYKESGKEFPPKLEEWLFSGSYYPPNVGETASKKRDMEKASLNQEYNRSFREYFANRLAVAMAKHEGGKTFIKDSAKFMKDADGKVDKNVTGFFDRLAKNVIKLYNHLKDVLGLGETDAQKRIDAYLQSIIDGGIPTSNKEGRMDKQAFFEREGVAQAMRQQGEKKSAIEKDKEENSQFGKKKVDEMLVNISKASNSKGAHKAAEPFRAALEKSLRDNGFVFNSKLPVTVLSDTAQVASKILAGDKADPRYISQMAEAASFLYSGEANVGERDVAARAKFKKAIELKLRTGKNPPVALVPKKEWDAAMAQAKKLTSTIDAEKLQGLRSIAMAIKYIEAGKKPPVVAPKGTTVTTFQGLMDKNPVLDTIFDVLFGGGYKSTPSLTGSMAYADQIEVYRNMDKPIHDVDVLFQNRSDIELAAERLGEVGSIKKLYDFNPSGNKQVAGLVFVPNKDHTVEIVSKKYTEREYVVKDANGKQVGSYKLTKKGKEMNEQFVGNAGVIVDLMFDPKARLSQPQPYTVNGKKKTITVTGFEEGMNAKLNIFRDKDVMDFALARRKFQLDMEDDMGVFIPEDKIKGKPVTQPGVKAYPDLTGDIWEQDGYKIITTNLGGVHGRGLAKQAKDKGRITNKHKDFDSRPDNDVITIAVKGKEPDTARVKGRAFSEQVVGKNVELLKSELDKLIALARSMPDKNFYIPYAGLGFGEGDANAIMPLLANAQKEPNIKLIARGKEVEEKYAESLKPGVRRDGSSRGKQPKTTQAPKPQAPSRKDVVIQSGGADGADTLFAEAGREHGIPTNAWSFKGHFVKSGDKKTLDSDLELLEFDEDIRDLANKYELTSTDPLQKRKDKDGNLSSYSPNLIRRNMLQVDNADAVIAVAPIARGKVQGGTRWAVYRGVEKGKPVYVYNMARRRWETWTGNGFEPINGTPPSYNNFAGIGSRAVRNNTHAGDAIRDYVAQVAGAQIQAPSPKVAELSARAIESLRRAKRLFPNINELPKSVAAVIAAGSDARIEQLEKSIDKVARGLSGNVDLNAKKEKARDNAVYVRQVEARLDKLLQQLDEALYWRQLAAEASNGYIAPFGVSTTDNTASGNDTTKAGRARVATKPEAKEVVTSPEMYKGGSAQVDLRHAVDIQALDGELDADMLLWNIKNALLNNEEQRVKLWNLHANGKITLDEYNAHYKKLHDINKLLRDKARTYVNQNITAVGARDAQAEIMNSQAVYDDIDSGTDASLDHIDAPTTDTDKVAAEVEDSNVFSGQTKRGKDKAAKRAARDKNKSIFTEGELELQNPDSDKLVRIPRLTTAKARGLLVEETLYQNRGAAREYIDSLIVNGDWVPADGVLLLNLAKDTQEQVQARYDEAFNNSLDGDSDFRKYAADTRGKSADSIKQVYPRVEVKVVSSTYDYTTGRYEALKKRLMEAADGDKEAIQKEIDRYLKEVNKGGIKQIGPTKRVQLKIINRPDAQTIYRFEDGKRVERHKFIRDLIEESKSLAGSLEKADRENKTIKIIAPDGAEFSMMATDITKLGKATAIGENRNHTVLGNFMEGIAELAQDGYLVKKSKQHNFLIIGGTKNNPVTYAASKMSNQAPKGVSAKLLYQAVADLDKAYKGKEVPPAVANIIDGFYTAAVRKDLEEGIVYNEEEQIDMYERALERTLAVHQMLEGNKADLNDLTVPEYLAHKLGIAPAPNYRRGSELNIDDPITYDIDREREIEDPKGNVSSKKPKYGSVPRAVHKILTGEDKPDTVRSTVKEPRISDKGETKTVKAAKDTTKFAEPKKVRKGAFEKAQKFATQLMKLAGVANSVEVKSTFDLTITIKKLRRNGFPEYADQLAAEQGRGSFVHIDQHGNATIYLDNKVFRDDDLAFTQIAHEIGHVVKHNMLNRHIKKDTAVGRMIRREFEKSGEPNIEEWFADQFAYWVADALEGKRTKGVTLERFNAATGKNNTYTVGIPKLIERLFKKTLEALTKIARSMRKHLGSKTESEHIKDLLDYMALKDVHSTMSIKPSFLDTSYDTFYPRVGDFMSEWRRDLQPPGTYRFGDRYVPQAVLDHRFYQHAKNVGTNLKDLGSTLFDNLVKTSDGWLRTQYNGLGEKISAFEVIADMTHRMAGGMRNVGKEWHVDPVSGERFYFQELEGMTYSQAAASQTDDKDGFIKVWENPQVAAQQEAGARWLQYEYYNVVKDATDEEKLAAIEELQTGEPKSKLAKDISALLVRMHDEYLSKRMRGLGRWEDNYFPHVFDIESVREKKDEFIQVLQDYFEKSPLEAAAVYDSIVEADGFIDWQPDKAFAPGSASKGKRQLKGNDAILAPFMVKELDAVMGRYMTQMTRRAEYELRWGARDAKGNWVPHFKLRKLVGGDDKGASVATAIGLAYDQGASVEQIQKAMNISEAYLGRYGLNTNPNIRRASSWAVTAMNYLFLPLATITSIVDLANPIIRGGSFADAFKSFSSAMRAYKDKNELWEAATLHGHVSNMILNEHLSAGFDNPYLTPGANKANDWFFKAIFLTQWTNLSRMYAMEMGKNFLYRHANGESEKSAEFLAELGVTAEQVLNWDGDMKSGPVASALNTFVRESIFHPDATQRPLWGSDPKLMVFWHLKQFGWSFYKQIGERLWNRIKKEPNIMGQIGVASALLWLLPFSILSTELKNILQYYMFGNDPYNHKDIGQYADTVLSRAGIYGPYQLIMDAMEAEDRGKFGAAAIMGPFISHSFDMFDPSIEFGTKVSRNLPFLSVLPEARKSVQSALDFTD